MVGKNASAFGAYKSTLHEGESFTKASTTDLQKIASPILLAKNADSDILSGARPQYDKAAKKFLSKRRLLARILHHLVPEFRHIGLKEIEETCIVDEPRVSEVPVDPGKTNHAFPPEIRGAAQEQSEDAEGTIYFDVFFYAKLPQNGKLIKFIINLEAQKDIPTTYPLMKRVEFYGSRLVSSQKDRDFEKSDYGSICKVYTIWLCFKTPDGYGSSINLYRPHEEHIYGDYEEDPEEYQLSNAIVAYIGDQRTENNLLNLFIEVGSRSNICICVIAFLAGHSIYEVTQRLRSCGLFMPQLLIVMDIVILRNYVCIKLQLNTGGILEITVAVNKVFDVSCVLYGVEG